VTEKAGHREGDSARLVARALDQLRSGLRHRSGHRLARAVQDPPYGRFTDAEITCQRRHRFALRVTLGDKLRLPRVELWFAAKRDAALARSEHARLGAQHDQAALELGQPGQYRQDQLAVWRRGIAPTVGQRAELRTGVCDRIDSTQQMKCCSRQPVDAGDDDNIAVLDRLHQPGQLRGR